MKNLLTIITSLTIIFFCLFTPASKAQNGETIVRLWIEGIIKTPSTRDPKSPPWAATKKHLYRIGDLGYAYEVYESPDGDDIKDMIVKKNLVYLLLKSGEIVVYNTQDYSTSVHIGLVNLSTDFHQLDGDDLYVLTSNTIYKSANNAVTWQADTTGLHGAFLYSISLDTLQNVYAATQNGLYSQSSSGNTWIRNTIFPESFCSVVFGDRKNRLFVATNQNLYKSNDGGGSFQIDTSGIGGMKVVSMGDDMYGNIYLVVNSTGGFQGSGDRVYRSGGGNQPFVRIDQPISAMNADALHPYIFNEVKGDSILCAATTLGLFLSSDEGNSWTFNNHGIKAKEFYGLVKADNGHLLTTTNAGCFSGLNAADSNWIKVYPVAGYLGGQPLYKDKNGILYTMGSKLFSDLNNETRLVLRSTDNGNTWQPDTNGISQVLMYTWFVDESGIQHAARFGNGSNPITLFVKSPSQSWTTDDMGYSSSNSDAPIIFGANGNGKIYFSQTSNMVWSKQGSGSWSPDTAGLHDAVYAFTHNKNHQMYAGAYTGVWKQTGTTWAKLNSPPSSTYVTLSAFAVAVDSTNRLWAAFSYFDNYGNAIGEGVFYTNNDGNNWYAAPFQIDTVTFRQLVVIGDSAVFGLSYYNGAYLFTGSSSGIPAIDQDGYKVNVFPDPTDGSFTLTVPPFTKTVEISNAAGEIIHVINPNNRQSLTFALYNSGIYFIRVIYGNRTIVKKLIVAM